LKKYVWYHLLLIIIKISLKYHLTWSNAEYNSTIKKWNEDIFINKSFINTHSLIANILCPHFYWCSSQNCCLWEIIQTDSNQFNQMKYFYFSSFMKVTIKIFIPKQNLFRGVRATAWLSISFAQYQLISHPILSFITTQSQIRQVIFYFLYWHIFFGFKISLSWNVRIHVFEKSIIEYFEMLNFVYQITFLIILIIVIDIILDDINIIYPSFQMNIWLFWSKNRIMLCVWLTLIISFEIKI